MNRVRGFCFRIRRGRASTLIARYAFGGWENRWTLLGLAQAYARIATGRNVQATFLHRPARCRWRAYLRKPAR